jgi:hypothetical protein
MGEVMDVDRVGEGDGLAPPWEDRGRERGTAVAENREGDEAGDRAGA